MVLAFSGHMAALAEALVVVRCTHVAMAPNTVQICMRCTVGGCFVTASGHAVAKEPKLMWTPRTLRGWYGLCFRRQSGYLGWFDSVKMASMSSKFP